MSTLQPATAAQRRIVSTRRFRTLRRFPSKRRNAIFFYSVGNQKRLAVNKNPNRNNFETFFKNFWKPLLDSTAFRQTFGGLGVASIFCSKTPKPNILRFVPKSNIRSQLDNLIRLSREPLLKWKPQSS